jgi:hypothetical protein
MKSAERSRRKFLSRMGLTTGTAFLTPILDSLLKSAYGVTVTQKRFVMHCSPHGYASGRLKSGSGTSWSPNAWIKAIEPIKPEVTVLLNVKNSTGSKVDNVTHGPGHSTWTGVFQGPPNGSRWPSAKGQSFDIFLANAVGKNASVKQVTLSGGSLFANKPNDTGVVAESNPATVIDKYFGGNLQTPSVSVAGPEAEKEQLKRRLFLDYMTKDIQRLKTRLLAGEEAEKLDRFLASVEEIAKETAGGTSGGEPLQPKNCGAPQVSGGDTLFRLAGHLLGCNVTRHISMGSGFPSSWHDPIWHQKAGDWQAKQMGLYNDYVRRLMVLWNVLKQYPENGGSVADNTLILHIPMAGNHHNGTADIPVVMVGNGGGALKVKGQMIDLQQKIHQSEVWTALARAYGVKQFIQTWGSTQEMGRPTSQFGKPEDGRVQNLMTDVFSFS